MLLCHCFCRAVSLNENSMLTLFLLEIMDLLNINFSKIVSILVLFSINTNTSHAHLLSLLSDTHSLVFGSLLQEKWPPGPKNCEL